MLRPEIMSQKPRNTAARAAAGLTRRGAGSSLGALKVQFQGLSAVRCAMDHGPNSSRVRDRNFRAVCRCGWTSLISISLGRLAQIYHVPWVPPMVCALCGPRPAVGDDLANFAILRPSDRASLRYQRRAYLSNRGSNFLARIRSWFQSPMNHRQFAGQVSRYGPVRAA